ncbi:MAG: phycobilisome rod-core linker polypeptide [Oculatellaceae cyanobacterium Prado106]|jgi:phycobilisome rod-core linker protein|nr:phycobilisome rod-core linker polypeptide [Oculatellaceae cyanobacterium Prado106]
MALPLITYSPSSRNHRVSGFEIPGDESPRIFTTENLPSVSDLDSLIQAAYRQIFNEQQMTKDTRQIALESQLRSGQITVREFIKGLATSPTFRSRNLDTNNNYRFVQMCVQRILGRDVYSDREKIAWSIVVATKGLYGFIEELVNSEEYLENFGEHTVPYQRRRILPNRTQGEKPFARMARYDEFYRDNLPTPSLQRSFKFDIPMSPTRWDWQKPPYSPLARQLGKAIAYGGGAAATLFVVAVFLSFFGWIHL